MASKPQFPVATKVETTPISHCQPRNNPCWLFFRFGFICGEIRSETLPRIARFTLSRKVFPVSKCANQYAENLGVICPVRALR